MSKQDELLLTKRLKADIFSLLTEYKYGSNLTQVEAVNQILAKVKQHYEQKRELSWPENALFYQVSRDIKEWWRNRSEWWATRPRPPKFNRPSMRGKRPERQISKR